MSARDTVEGRPRVIITQKLSNQHHPSIPRPTALDPKTAFPMKSQLIAMYVQFNLPCASALHDDDEDRQPYEISLSPTHSIDLGNAEILLR